MNDAQSTVAGLKAQDCPGGGWNGMPKDIEERGATVADCLNDGSCGCIYGDAVQHIERLRAEAEEWRACALYDPKMDGPQFKGWNRSSLDRCRRQYIEARVHEQKAEER